MEEREPSTAAEMVSVFLRGELSSSRFSVVRDILHVFGIDETIFTAPDLDDQTANHVRSLVLFASRGYPIRMLFSGFPSDFTWTWCTLEADELPTLLYINVSPWTDAISRGTRSPVTGAAYVNDNPDEAIAEVCTSIASRLRARESLPPMILVGPPDRSRLVVLEGNARLTAMVIANEDVPYPVRVLCGASRNVARWDFY